MLILSIDPASNVYKTSTTGIVLLDNADCVDTWVVKYGCKNFLEWFHEVGKTLKPDIILCERYDVKHGDRSRDNSVRDTIGAIEACYPDLVLYRNTGYMKDIPDELLKAIDLYDFGKKTHHKDLTSAARLALFYAVRQDMEEVVQAIGRKLEQKLNT